MKFGITDFEEMREWIKTLPAPNPKMAEWRLEVFDIYRYSEQYENIYDYIRGLGGEVE